MNNMCENKKAGEWIGKKKYNLHRNYSFSIKESKNEGIFIREYYSDYHMIGNRDPETQVVIDEVWIESYNKNNKEKGGEKLIVSLTTNKDVFEDKIEMLLISDRVNAAFGIVSAEKLLFIYSSGNRISDIDSMTFVFRANGENSFYFFIKGNK